MLIVHLLGPFRMSCEELPQPSSNSLAVISETLELELTSPQRETLLLLTMFVAHSAPVGSNLSSQLCASRGFSMDDA